MLKDRPSSAPSEADAPGVAPAGDDVSGSASPPPCDLVVGSHDALFDAPDETGCDACGQPLDQGADDGFGMPGRGVYLWARGADVRRDTVPLCASCASAIGLTALARWEIEEEEG